MGGERKLVLSLIVFVGLILISNVASVTTWVVGVALYAGGLAGIRKLAAKDPRFSEVYARQLKYQPYYPPRRGLDAPRVRRRLG